MRRIFLFVFALACVNATLRTGFQQYENGNPTTVIQMGTFAPAQATQTATVTGNPYETLIAKLESRVGTLTADQKAGASAILKELHASLTAANKPANLNLAAYLLASTYQDTSLLATEEKLVADEKKKSIQTAYFELGFQGRGFVHFTGAFNYNRFSQYTGLDFSSTPALLLTVENAAKVLVYGALNGKFTGAKIEKFIPANGTADFVKARRAINGDLKATEIAKLAKEIVA